MADDGAASNPLGGVDGSKAGVESEPSKGGFPAVSLNIWPPSQRTRDAVIERLIKTLSTSSLVNKRYGTFPVEEATPLAQRIEQEAFAAAAAPSDGGSASDDEGIEVLHSYSKEISNRMMEAITSKSSLAPSAFASEDDTGIAKSTPADSVSAVTHADEDVTA